MQLLQYVRERGYERECGEDIRDRDAHPPCSDLLERDLLERCRRGDDGAFRVVVERYGGRMLATARRILVSEVDARDAVQDAFLSAFKSIERFAGSAKLSTWLHRIVVNAALMKLRTRRRRPEAAIEDLLPRFDDQGGWAIAPQRWESPSEMQLRRKETRAAVRRAIDRLPDEHRAILVLRDLEEHDTHETAAALGLSVSAAKTRLHRARHALRTLLEREIQTFADW